MMSASGTPSGCIVLVGSLAGGVAGALPPANSLQASGLLIKGHTLGSLVPEVCRSILQKMVFRQNLFRYSLESKPTSQTFSSVQTSSFQSEVHRQRGL